MTRLIVVAVGLEVLALTVGLALGGTMGGVAALFGASVATGAQIVAVVLLRPAVGTSMKSGLFQQRWALGMAVRFASFIVLAALMITMKAQLPPLWLAAGYLGTMLVLLFAETQFLT